MDTLVQDVRYAARSLLRHRTTTLAAVLCLALGIGANTTAFSASWALVFDPLPIADAGRVMMVVETPPNGGRDASESMSAGAYLDLRGGGVPAFSAVSAAGYWDVNITGIAEPERMHGLLAAPDLFATLGVAPALGRFFTAAEAEPGADRVVVLGHGLWQRRFGADPAIVGKTTMLNGEAFTIVGVAPKDFSFTPGVQLWAPLSLGTGAESRRSPRSLLVLARLAPGASPAEAARQADTFGRRLAERYPEASAGWRVRVEPVVDHFVSGPRPYMLMLQGSVGLVLLIACANVANLLLARAASRRREVAVRVALGASRGRVVRQLLTESLILALVGGSLGLLLSLWGMRAYRGVIPAELMPLMAGTQRLVIDGRAVAFTVLASLASAVVFGLVPAFHGSSVDLQSALKVGGRGAASGDGRGGRLRSLLVGYEVALALTLLAGATLMTRSLMRLLDSDPGFRDAGVLTMRITLPGDRYRSDTAATRFFTTLIEHTGALPGVQAAGAVSFPPMGWGSRLRSFTVEGRPTPPRGETPSAGYRVATPGYLASLSIPLRAGRWFAESDAPGAPNVVAVSEGLARRHWPGLDPGRVVGERIHVEGLAEPSTVVGVVADVQHNLNIRGEPPLLYLPMRQRSQGGMSLVVRVTGDPARAAPAVQREVAALDRGIAPGDVMTMRRLVQNARSPQRGTAGMLGVLALTALVLAAVGVYGVVAYGVSQRSREIAVRIALGATRADVMRLVVGGGMRPVLVGALVGLAGGVGVAQALRSLLYGVRPTDMVTFAIVPLVLLGSALLANWLPARRAAKVDPMAALRDE